AGVPRVIRSSQFAVRSSTASGERRAASGERRYTLSVHITDLQTPCVLVERSRVARNIDRMQAAADRKRIRLRPHAKTHKSPQPPPEQLGRGAVGGTCAKPGEGGVLADAGVAAIRIAYPLTPVTAPRVVALADRGGSRSSSITRRLRARGRR